MELYKLTNENISVVTEKVGELYEQYACTKKETLRAKLLLEEALLKYQGRFGEETEFCFRTYRMFTQMRFIVRVRTASFDPFTLEENPMAFMLSSIMNGFEDKLPVWKYRNLENEITFTVRKKARRTGAIRIVLALVLSLFAGLAARFTFPREGLTTFVEDYVEPLASAYVGLFGVMAVLLTFFAFVLTVIRVGDLTTLGEMGGRILRRFFSMLGALVTVGTLLILPFFRMSGGGAVSVSAKSIYDILIGFFPGNLVAPFLEFNSVHIMIVGLMFGLSLLAAGNSGDTLVRLFTECNTVAATTNGFLSRFIYLYVAMKVFSIMTTGDFSALAGAGKPVLATLVFLFLLFVFYTVYGSLRCGVSPRRYLQVMMPPFLICLSSANYGACIDTLFGAFGAMHTDEGRIPLSLNIGGIVFQPCYTLFLIVSALFMAEAYGVAISPVWVLTAVVLSVLLVSSMPNVPGAAVSVLTLLYAQLGLPSSALAMMITVNAVMQFPLVAVDEWCLAAEVTLLTRKED